MELNRNQYFFAGIVILLLGAQLRVVESCELTPEATRVLRAPAAMAKNDSTPTLSINNAGGAFSGSRKVLSPPEWLGWCLISVGSVLILHSLAMKKPG